MKFQSILYSHHDLKKNGYKMLRKLHKLELKRNLSHTYAATCEEGYFVVLCYRNLFEIIQSQYIEYQQNELVCDFVNKSNSFLLYLEEISKNKARINKRRISSYLTAYTTFFNKIAASDIRYVVSRDLLIKWNARCLMAYIAVWGQ